jgi:hypothetical protein
MVQEKVYNKNQDKEADRALSWFLFMFWIEREGEIYEGKVHNHYRDEALLWIDSVFGRKENPMC